MFRISKNIHCDICDALTETKRQDVQIIRLGKTYLLKDASVEVCPNCQETYISGQTAKNFEKLVQNSLVSTS